MDGGLFALCVSLHYFRSLYGVSLVEYGDTARTERESEVGIVEVKPESQAKSRTRRSVDVDRYHAYRMYTNIYSEI